MVRRILSLALIAAAVASPAFAVAIAPGASLFAIEVGNGSADFAGPEDGTGYIGAYEHSEWGVRGEFWKMINSDYAWNISGGASWFSETDKPGDNALPGSEDLKYTQSSWHVRIGGDRVVNVGERGAIYFGPGLEYWSGTATFENIFSASSDDTPSTVRYSFYGRIGGLMTIGRSWGLTGHVGHRIGYATAKQAGAETTWWPSGFEGSGGLVFTFGGSASQ